MAIRKTRAKKLLSSLLVLSLMGSLASFPAYAEGEDSGTTGTDATIGESTDVDEPISSNYGILVEFTDAYSTSNTDDVCYPGRPYAYDASVTLTVDGVSYQGVQSTHAGISSTREYKFPGLTSVPASATLSIDTNAETFINLDDAGLYQYKLSTNLDKDIPDTTYVTLTKDDWYSIDEGGRQNRARVYATADDYGLCSVLIVDELYDIKTTSWVWEHRKEYTPEIITDVIASVSGTQTSEGTPVSGVVHFRVPAKWDSTVNEYTKRANVTLDIVGVDTEILNAPYSAKLELSVDEAGISAYEKYYRLSDCNFSYFDDEGPVDEGEPDEDEPIVDEGGDEDTDTTGTYIKLAVDTTLDKYNLDLVSEAFSVELFGKITQEFIDMYGFGKLGDKTSWAEVDIYTDNTAEHQVSAGDYTIEGNALLDLSYKGKLTVKENATNDVTLKVSPKYTLELTSKAGTIDCTVDGAAFDGETKINFMLEGNKTYYIVDNDTGYAYELKATDETPHLKLTLGSTTGAIIPDDDATLDDFEDVPNTSDNISVMGIVCGICVILFAGSFFFVYRLNKKEERRKR